MEALFEVATSKLSSMPDGGAIELLALFPYQPSTRDPSTPTFSEGAAISLVFALYWPPSGPSGAARSTPPNAVTPPVAPTDDENRHVYDEGSNPETTLK